MIVMWKKIATLSLATILAAGMAEAQDTVPDIHRAPPWADIEAQPVSTIVEYARALPWDTSPWAADTRHLVFQVVNELRVGPLVRLSPRADANLASMEELEAGRFVARYESGTAVPSMGISTGATYVWMHQRDDRWEVLMFRDPPPVDPLLYPRFEDLNPEEPPSVAIPVGELRVLVFPEVCSRDAREAPNSVTFMMKEPSTSGAVADGCFPCDCTLCCVGPFRTTRNFSGPQVAPPGFVPDLPWRQPFRIRR